MATRMAGSDEFKAELDRATSNKAARERIAASPERTAERLSGLDRNSYDFSGFSDMILLWLCRAPSLETKTTHV